MIKNYLIPVLVMGIIGCKAPAPKMDMKTNIAVVHGAEPMKMGEVMQVFPKMTPVNLVSFPANSKCKLLRASTNSFVANITSYENGKARAPMRFIQQVRYVENIGTPQRQVKMAYQTKRPDVSDVIVTETSKPVSLLLTSYSRTLWVIHTVPGVEIENINVMSYQGAAVVAPQVTSDKVNFIVQSDATKSCWKKPVRYSNAKDAAAGKPAGNYKRTKADYAKYRANEKYYKNWLSWVKRNIGPVDVSIDRSYALAGALVGEPPLQPIAPTPIGGDIFVDYTDSYDIFWGSKKFAQEKFPPPPKRKRQSRSKMLKDFTKIDQQLDALEKK